MGFIRDIRRILALLPKKRQNLLFSATFSDEIRELSKGVLTDPIEISVARRNTASELVAQSMVLTEQAHKRDLLRDRKSVVEGKSVSVRVDIGGGRILQKKKSTKRTRYNNNNTKQYKITTI